MDRRRKLVGDRVSEERVSEERVSEERVSEERASGRERVAKTVFSKKLDRLRLNLAVFQFFLDSSDNAVAIQFYRTQHLRNFSMFEEFVG